MTNDATQIDADFRRFLHAQNILLKEISLQVATDAFLDFFLTSVYTSIADDDGFVIYLDYTSDGLEIGFVRLVVDSLVEERMQRALRLRLSLFFPLTLEGVTKILPDGSWSLHTWVKNDAPEICRQAQETVAFKVLSGEKLRKARIRLDSANFYRHQKSPPADARQMWWGI